MVDLLNELTVGLDKNKINSCLDILHKQSKIVLFGAGQSGRTILKWMLKNSVQPIGFVDSDINKVGSCVYGVNVYEKDWLLGDGENSYIIVSCGDYGIIVDELKKMEITYTEVMYIDPKWITHPEGLEHFIYKNISSLQRTLETLADRHSMEVFINMLKYKISYNDSYIRYVCNDFVERYFDTELIDFSDINNYVDAGAYNGDTLIHYINKCNGSYDNIYVFEPNEMNMLELNNNIRYNNYKNIHTYQIGLSDKHETLSFDLGSGLSTKVSEYGTQRIECESLDNLLVDKRVDFIKMDIEGSELKALIGASNIIKKYNPILAICVYHKPEDFFEIPLKIKELNPSYKIYFRQYEFTDTETICYAIGD